MTLLLLKNQGKLIFINWHRQSWTEQKKNEKSTNRQINF